MADENRRIFEYFVVAGLGEEPIELTPGAQECGARNASPQAPVTDICIVFPSLGEETPDGFTRIDTTPSGYPADLNHGSLRTASCYLCYRRGHHKPPLVDIGVLYEGKGERVMVDSQILQTTPFGRPANVNNASQGIYVTYRRAADNAPPNLLAVTDVSVILANKGETPPHTFCKIAKNLNKGMVGSDVFICYKKSQANANRIAYKPEILDRFPVEDEEGLPLPPNVPIFCLPMGAVIECWPAKCQAPGKLFSTFILTDEKGRKLYGAAVTFYERYEAELSVEQLERLGLNPESQLKSGSVSDNSSTNDPAEQMTFHQNKSICVVGRYPFFTAFKRFLFYLHRMSVTGSYPLPIERYISHLMYEVPFPTVRRPRVLVQLGNETVSFDNYDDSQLPLSGAAFIDLLKNCNVENSMYVVLLALLEQKILLHSLRPWVLTSVSEAVCSLIFPFHWQCPYIPQCPLDLAGVLHAPLPFICGVDSRYFELYDDPPRDVTCLDLDTATISLSDVRKTIKLSMFPRKPTKLLKQTLEHLYRRVHQEDFNVTAMRRSTEFMPIDIDFQIQKKRKNLELEIQEAFLRFMAAIMKGYISYLKPIRSAPKIGSTDTGALFDLEGFLRTRDRSGSEFYKRFHDTQCFIRFIEERSLLSDRNTFHAFFDDCVAKVEPTNSSLDCEPKLLEYESSLNSNHTVFIAPPESFTLEEEGQVYSFHGFPKKLHINNYQLDTLAAAPSKLLRTPARPRSGVMPHTTPAVRRTKQEAKSAQRTAKKLAIVPLRWAKCVLGYTYSLWFIHLPAFLAQSHSKQKALRIGMIILDRMEKAELPVLDEVCYRIMMELSGQCGKPLMAVKVHMAMKQRNMDPNAVTYGIYHRAVLEAKWPSMNALNAVKAWTKLRHAVRAIALLKQGRRNAIRQRRTLSQFSHESGVDYGQSLTSLNSQGVKNADQISINTVTSCEKAETNSVGDVLTEKLPPDHGYHSQTTVNSGFSGRTDEIESVKFRSIAASDLEIFDEFQHKKRSIIDPKRTSSFSNRTSLGSYDSPAGLLMTSGDRSSILDDSVFDSSITIEPKLDLSDRRSGGFEPKKLAEDVHLLTGCSVQKQTEEQPVFDTKSLSEIPEETCVEPVSPKSFSVSPTRSMRTEVTGSDPLSVFSGHEGDTTEKQPLIMSPSKRVIVEEEPILFEGEEFQANELSTPTDDSYWSSHMKGWLNKVGSAGMQRLIRSHTVGESLDSPSEMQFSPSLNSLVSHASKLRNRMGDVVTKQQPNITRLRTGVSSMMKEIRSFKGNLDQLGSPLRGSLGSLDATDATTPDAMRTEDTASLKDDEGLRYLVLENGLMHDLPDDDPAFQLSSGEPGTILVTDNHQGLDEVKQLLEVLMCTCTKCPHCNSLLYDEEIIAGWRAEESNLNSVCQFCDQQYVPVLTVKIRIKNKDNNGTKNGIQSPASQSWYAQENRGTKRKDLSRLAVGSVESLSSLPDTPYKLTLPDCGRPRAASDIPETKQINRQLFPTDDTVTPVGESASETSLCSTLDKEIPLNVPYLSPLVLRREMENVLSGDEMVLTKPQFMETHPILYWNLVYFFQRLCVPSHLFSWITNAYWPAGTTPPRLLVRCVYDQPKLHEDECSRPLYLEALEPVQESHKSSDLVAALLLEERCLNKAVVQKIVNFLEIPNLLKPIQLLINEHRKNSPIGSAPARHLSIYRDILFLAFVYFGREVKREDFDKEYASAFRQLAPRVASMLPPADQPPKLTARACRRIFMPLDVW